MEYNNYEPSNLDLQNQLAVSSNAMSNELYLLRRHIDKKFAPPRAKQTSYSISCNQNGELVFNQFYDIAPGQSFFVFTNTLGPFALYRVKTVDFNCNKNLFGIYFERSQIWIVGDIDKLSEKYLYEIFLDQKISFYQGISRSKVQRALYEFFKGVIYTCKNTMTIPALAGWLGAHFYHSLNVTQSPSLKMLPVSDKHFEILSLQADTFTLYKNFLKRFVEDRARLIIALYPIASLLASVFKKFRENVNFTLNIVPTSTLNITDVAEYFQTFSRDTLCAFHSSDSQKNIERILQHAKDEVLIMDMRITTGNDYYRLKQRHDRFDFVHSVLSGRINIANQSGNAATAGLVTVCDEILLKPNVFNMLTTKEFDTLSVHDDYTINLFKERKVMPRIISQFVQFMEQKNEDFITIFSKNTSAHTHAGAILEIVYNLFSEFWQSRNIDFAEELDFPKTIDFDEIFLPESDDGDEEISIFIEKIKSALCEYYIVSKRGAKPLDNCIFCDDAHVYFPMQIMESICSGCAIKNYKKFLVKLRKKNFLSASPDRLTKQMVVGHKTLTCYVLHRELFVKTGELDIRYLGKDLNHA